MSGVPHQWVEWDCNAQGRSGQGSPNWPALFVQRANNPSAPASGLGSIGCGTQLSGRISRIYAHILYSRYDVRLQDSRGTRNEKHVTPEFKAAAYDNFAKLGLTSFQLAPEEEEEMAMSTQEELEKEHIEVTARDLQRVFPEAVTSDPQSGNNETDVFYVDMDYMNSVQTVVIQQLQERVKSQQERLEALEKKLADNQSERENGFMSMLEQALKDFRGGRD
ncbi:unnamed protein product [Vitrella brassicaformis CCMP3155]|uniref:Peptidase S74 domain-containing protein n=2 Tax=Vitrella brassicaformis TaxID=1169539 RepID=A0A0G4EV33_VITBC|nr:unnamed protein product [Vitrella brassicaformis CCMP3155]|eukprot:CEM02114.1 unnamed protein product [Vitrella brassicaformis CCMP3155]